MPMKPPIACTHKGCSRLAKAGDGGLCSVHKKARHDNYSKMRGDKSITRIYGTKAWKLARRMALERDNGWCVMCQKKPAILVDHIKELKDGGSPYDLSNLQSLCHACHTKKTKEYKML